MRWKLLCRGLALMLAGVVGCNQTYYVTPDDLAKVKDLGLPNNLAENPFIAVEPVTQRSNEPSDIRTPDRPIRFMSLAEAIAIALEQGTVGNQNTAIGNLFGSIQSITTSVDQPVSFNGGTGGRVGSSDSIRVLRLDPAIIGAGIESSLSKFDAVWTSSASWAITDRPVATSTDQVQTGGQNISAINQTDASVTTGIVKPLPSGGVAGITFSNAYQLTNLPARVNPSYRPTAQVTFEQPLLQGFGVEINQLRNAHPGILFNNPTNSILNTQPTAEGILITRVRFDQQRAEFERNVHIMVLNVELAYWNLYYGYWNLYAQEQGLRFAYEAWKISKSQLDAGRVAIDVFAQTRGQYETFRASRLNALNDTLELERQLRAMLGMQGDDGKRLVPSDQPTVAPYQPNWEVAQNEALALRPELYMARQEVKASQMNLILQKNALLPDLRVGLSYDINSIGGRLDGPSAANDPANTNALSALSSDHFNNWSAQLRLNVPIGFRNAHSNVRIAQLQLARAFETLKDQEQKSISFLEQQYRRLPVSYELIRTQRAAREAFGQQLQVKYNKFIAGRETPDTFLEAQRFWADALSKEYLAIRDYNNALASFEYAKGTVLTRNNIVISEGALPGFAQKRAVEHLGEKDAALTLLERPNAVPLTTAVQDPGVIGNTAMENSAPRLTEMFKQVPPLKDAPMLPTLTKGDDGKTPASTTAPSTTLPDFSKASTRTLPPGSSATDFGSARTTTPTAPVEPSPFPPIK